MIHPLTFSGQPPVTPELVVPCYRAQLPEGLADELALAVVDEKPRILAQTPVPDWCHDVTNLTSRFTLYNLFHIDRPEFLTLEAVSRQEYTNYMQAIGAAVEPCYIRGWANAYTQGDRLVWHNHFEAVRGVEGPVWSHISGNVCVQTFGTRTWYLSPFLGGVGHDEFGNGYEYPADVIGVPNVNGETFLFPSWLVHKTEPNAHPTLPRITIAYDIIPESVYARKTGDTLFKRLI
jgi:hypothetical protein